MFGTFFNPSQTEKKGLIDIILDPTLTTLLRLHLLI